LNNKTIGWSVICRILNTCKSHINWTRISSRTWYNILYSNGTLSLLDYTICWISSNSSLYNTRRLSNLQLDLWRILNINATLYSKRIYWCKAYIICSNLTTNYRGLINSVHNKVSRLFICYSYRILYIRICTNNISVVI